MRGGASRFRRDGPGRGVDVSSSTMDAFDEAVAAGFGNTTLGVVATNAQLDKAGCLVVAQGGHDGLARARLPRAADPLPRGAASGPSGSFAWCALACIKCVCIARRASSASCERIA